MTKFYSKNLFTIISFTVKYNVYLICSLRYFELSQIYFFWDADNSVSLKSESILKFESMLKFDGMLKFNIILLTSQFKCLMKRYLENWNSVQESVSVHVDWRVNKFVDPCSFFIRKVDSLGDMWEQ